MQVQTINLPKIDESIQYALENGLWLNATEVAKRHNKRLDNYFSNLETIKYMERLRVLNPSNSRDLTSQSTTVDIDDFVISMRGKYGGTYIHESLIIHFARWINIDFAIACDLFIKDTIVKTTTERVIAELKAPKIQKDNFMSLRACIKHYKLDIKETKAKALLIDKKLLKVEEVIKKTKVTKIGDNAPKDKVKAKGASILFEGEYLKTLLNNSIKELKNA